MQKLVILSLFVLGFINTTLAQNFTISSELRPRAEIREGYKSLLSDDDHFAAQVSQRTRLNFGYQKEILSMYISVQDIRLWGDVAWKKDVAGTFINEAWANLKLGETASVKFGHQELKYDNQRLIAVANWNQISARHDAAKFQFHKNGWNIDFVAAYNQSDNLLSGTFYDIDKFYKTLNILWISKKIGNFDISTLHIADGYQDEVSSKTLYVRYTPGVAANFKNNNFSISGRTFYQTGLIKKDTDISAYYFNIEAGQKFTNKFSLIAGLDYLSGDDTDNDTYNSFDVLYGKRHGMNGYIDYFNTPSTTKDGGLINPYLKFKTKLSEKSELGLDYHYFSLQQNTINTGEEVDKYLGSEIDITWKFNYSKDIGLMAGYSVMFASETTEIIKSGDKNNLGNFVYFMITIKPTLFRSNE